MITELSNTIGLENDLFSNAGGRRQECKSRGLKGKAFNDCLKGLRTEDKGKSKEQKKTDKKTRKDNLNQALVDGKVKKGKGARKLASVGLSPMRAAFRLLINLNVWDLAGKLKKLKELAKTDAKAKSSWNKALASYIKKGGKVKNFEQVIEKGAKKRPLIIRMKKNSGFDGIENLEFFSQMTGAEAPAAAAASSPIWIPILSALVAVAPLIGKVSVNKDDEATANELANSSDAQISEEEAKMFAENPDNQSGTEEGDTIFGLPKMGVIIGSVVLAAAIITVVVLKSRSK
jgi:hypothetical protein